MMRFNILPLILLSGCVSTLIDYSSSTYFVQPEDTLISIAWNYQITTAQILFCSNLDDSDSLFYGQKITLRCNLVNTSNNDINKVDDFDLSGFQSLPIPVTPSVINSAITPFLDLADSDWSSPVKGEVTRVYGQGDLLSNGIRISAMLGNDVYATNYGRVVYVGSNVIGYQSLILIQHANDIISAYGFVENILVTTGDMVSVGDVIGQVGIAENRQPGIHYEIRSRGAPINPIGFIGQTQ
jgi:lipoprotein NlpD